MQYLAYQGMRVETQKDETRVYNKSGRLYLIGSHCQHNILHWFDAEVITHDVQVSQILSINKMEIDYPTWHSCLGHPNDKVIRQVPKLLDFAQYPSDWYKPVT